MSAVFEHTVQARLIAEPPAARTLTVTLRYDAGDPLAVRIVFSADASLDGTDVSWAFARELLDTGLREPAGEGDVHIRPCGPGRAVIELLSDEGVAVLEFSRPQLRRFLLRAYALVPPGGERSHLHLDTGLTALLRGV